ncbi:hypothetical protein EGW08_016277 [Elysia chlorotica]|uniref:Uncharacterized protein n=1 Tax=Elysia chlorotica TaxID=188477 RepID=A0A433T390_ELYCH|nr:hypothetical protein EGW08_016277 [Elysia chlorotica]
MENTGTLGRSSCILALLLLTVVSTGSTPVGAQASDHCDRELMACLNKHVTRFDHTKMDTAKSCRILQDFSGCVSNITCLKEEARDELVTNMTVSFKKLGFNCDPDIKVSVEPLPSSVPHDTGMANPCDEAKNNCTKTLVEESFQIGTDMKDWFCPGLNRYLDCLMKAPCDMDNYGQTVSGLY